MGFVNDPYTGKGKKKPKKRVNKFDIIKCTHVPFLFPIVYMNLVHTAHVSKSFHIYIYNLMFFFNVVIMKLGLFRFLKWKPDIELDYCSLFLESFESVIYRLFFNTMESAWKIYMWKHMFLYSGKNSLICCKKQIVI